MTKAVSEKITFLSFVMSIFIVLYHTSGVVRLDTVSSGVYFARLFDLCAPIALGYFFAVSAFLFYNDKKRSIKEKIKRRWKSLMIPFFIWNVIEAVFLEAIHQIEINSFFDLVLKCTLDPFDGPTWYIFAIFLMFCSSPIIEKIGVNKKKTMVLFVFCFLLSLMISYWFYNFTSHGLYWLERVVRYFPAYILGFAIAKYGDIIKFEKYDKKKYSMISRLSLAIIYSIIVIMGLSEESVLGFCLLRLLPVLLWFSFDKIDYVDVHENIYKISFLIFVMHDMAIRILGKMYTLIFANIGNGIWIIVTARLLITALAIIVIYIFSLLFKKYFGKTYAIVSGNR